MGHNGRARHKKARASWREIIMSGKRPGATRVSNKKRKILSSLKKKNPSSWRLSILSVWRNNDWQRMDSFQLLNNNKVRSRRRLYAVCIFRYDLSKFVWYVRAGVTDATLKRYFCTIRKCRKLKFRSVYLSWCKFWYAKEEKLSQGMLRNSTLLLSMSCDLTLSL